MFFVYTVTHRASGRIYVGKTYNAAKRWNDHQSRARRGSTTWFHSALRKHGPEAFEWLVIEVYETDEQAKHSEEDWIARIRNAGVPSYNLTDGGDGAVGYKHTPESLRKMGDVHRGQLWTEEQRERMSRALRGRTLTSEHREKIAASKRGKPRDEQTRLKLAEAARGKSLSPEARAKVGEANRNRPHRKWTDEEKRRQSELLRGRSWSAARRAAQQAGS